MPATVATPTTWFAWEFSGLWLAGNGGLEEKMETNLMGRIRTTTGIHSFIPSSPKAGLVLRAGLNGLGLRT